jgi:hypothetical protein
MWLNQLYRRWTGRTRTNRRARRATARRRTRLTLEALEDRTLLSAPDAVTISGMSESGASQFNLANGGSVSGTAFLGGSFNTSASIGSISDGFGAEVNFSMAGKAGLGLNYFASAGQVDAAYGSFTLNQNYTEPTQFGQEVNFTPQNTNVSYTSGVFATTPPTIGGGINLQANISGSISGQVAAFGDTAGDSTTFSTGDINQPLISYSSTSGLEVFGQPIQEITGANGQVDGVAYSGQIANSVEIPIEIAPGVDIDVTVGPNSSATGLQEGIDLAAGLTGGDDSSVEGAMNLGFASQTIPVITLNSNSLQSNGVLSSSGGSTFATLSVQMGPLLVNALQLPGYLALATDTDTLKVGPASVSITPVSFAMGPDLSFQQTGTVTPTNQLTYTFFNNITNQAMKVDVTKDGVDLGRQSSVTFTPGVDAIGVQFTGTPIEVQPTWTYGMDYTNEVDLDVGLQGLLTIGQLTGSIDHLGSFTLGPLYQQSFDFFDTKLATVYDKTFSIYSGTPQILTPFVIGSGFNPSLNVTQFSDGTAPGSLRAAVLTANLPQNNTPTSPPQVIHLGSGTYNLTIAPNSSGQGYSGGLYVTAGNLTIEGAGAGRTFIKASATLGDRIFDVASGANLTLQGVTVENGPSGGILNSGNLTIDNSTLADNSAQDGGGIYNAQGGTLAVSNSTLTNNQADTGSGGGIYNDGAASVNDSTLSDNGADDGGGIFNQQSGELTVLNSTLSNNGAILGGGIYNNQDQSQSGFLHIFNSTLYGNTSLGSGGALWDSQSSKANTLLLNDTLTNNRANFDGNDSSAQGGGIYVAGGGVPLLGNTIVAGNYNGASSSTTPDDISGSVDTTNSANNLIGAGGSGGLQNGSNGNQLGVADPGLGTFGNNGGPTQTVPLLLNSPAIDAGGNSWVTKYNLSTDQRGAARSVNGKVDIGAVEFENDLALSGYLASGTALGTVQYLYTVTNNGPDPVTGATLNVTLPQGMVLQSQDLPTGWIELNPRAASDGKLTIENAERNPSNPSAPPTLLELTAGQSATFTIAAQEQNTSVGMVLATTAAVSPTTWDNNPQNNSLTLTATNEQEAEPFQQQAGLTTLTNAKLFHFALGNNFNANPGDFTATVNWGDGSTNSTSDGSRTVSVVADSDGGFDVVGSHTYAKAGNYTISVTANDPKNLFFSYLATAPALQNVKLFHFTSSNANATASDFTVAVNWGDGNTNTSGDGSGRVSVVADPSGGFDVFGSHSYPNANLFFSFFHEISGTISGPSLNTPTFSTQVVEDIPDNAVKLFHFSDVNNPNATADDFTAQVAWGDGSGNFSNDGSGDVSVIADPNGGFDVLGAHTYAQSGNYGIAVVVTCQDGTTYSSGSATQSYSNVNLFHFTGAAGMTAGDYTATVNWGDGTTTTIAALNGAFGNAGQIVADPGGGFDVLSSHTYSQIGNYTVSVDVRAGATFPPPVVLPFRPTGFDLPSFHLTSADASATAKDFTATVAWGDGSSNTSSDGSDSVSITTDPNGGFDVTGSHVYDNPATASPLLTITGPGVEFSGNTTLTTASNINVSAPQQMFVAEVAPLTAGALTPPNAVVNQNIATFQNVILYHFTQDNAKAGDFSATVDWGDNSSNNTSDGSGTLSVAADPNGGFDVIGSHAYAAVGNYPITVSVKGPDGKTQEKEQIFQYGFNLLHFLDADLSHSSKDYKVTVSWGDKSKDNSNDDGTGTVAVVADPNGGFDVLAQHVYTQTLNAADFKVAVVSAEGAEANAGINNFQVLNPDQPLTAGTLSVPSVATEGQSISNQVLFHFSDADSKVQASQYLAFVSWGDGTFSSSDDKSGSVQVVADPSGGFNVVGSHVYSAGSYVFGVKVTDQGDPGVDNGGQVVSASSAAPLTLADPAVVVSAGPTFTAGVNSLSSVQTVATFTDPGGPQASTVSPTPYVATIQWGDGTATVASPTAEANYTQASVNSQGQIIGQLVSASNVPGIVLDSDGKTFSINLAHQYAQAGQYTLSVLVNHDGELSQTTTTAIAGTLSPPPAPPPSAPPPAPPPAPFQPPTLQVPPLLAFFDSLLGATETINANRTETLAASFFGIPLLVSTFDSSGRLESVLLFGMNVTALFEML